MAITLFHKIINNRIVIINNETKKNTIKKVKVSGDIKATKHTISEIKNYD